MMSWPGRCSTDRRSPRPACGALLNGLYVATTLVDRASWIESHAHRRERVLAEVDVLGGRRRWAPNRRCHGRPDWRVIESKPFDRSRQGVLAAEERLVELWATPSSSGGLGGEPCSSGRRKVGRRRSGWRWVVVFLEQVRLPPTRPTAKAMGRPDNRIRGARIVSPS